MLKVDQVHAIRHQVLRQGRSVRTVAREMGISRNTVRKYLGQPEPVRVERQPRPQPKLDLIRARLDQLVDEWSDRTTAKQRITGTRLARQLRDDGFPVGTTLVRKYLRERRRLKLEAHVPLVHRPGDDALVDFFEIAVEVGGQRRKAWLFLMRLMHSGRDFAAVYERQDQVSFLDGHVKAFEHFGAVPQRCVYDNLALAVRKILMPERLLTDRFKAVVNHYGFEPCFARPGEGHDKGGVESRGRGIRLQQLTPIPSAASWDELSAALQARLDAEADDRRDASGRSVSERFAEDLSAMRPLPPTRFEARRVVAVSIARTAVARIEGATYSVPSSWKLLEATALVGPHEVTITCRGQSTVKPRQRFGGRAVRYRDYLPELARKPQALRQVAPELVPELGEPFTGLWDLLMKTHGGHEAARVMSRILAAMQEHGEQPVRDALAVALQAGRVDLVALASVTTVRTECPVPAALAHHHVEAAHLADYDVLLRGHA